MWNIDTDIVSFTSNSSLKIVYYNHYNFSLKDQKTHYNYFKSIQEMQHSNLLYMDYLKTIHILSKILLVFYYIPERFNTNNALQLFAYTITFVNSQHQNTNSYVILNSIPGFKRSFQRFMVYKNKSDSDLVLQIQLISI